MCMLTLFPNTPILWVVIYHLPPPLSLTSHPVGLGEKVGGGPGRRKRMKERKVPVALLEDGQMMSATSMEVRTIAFL